MPTVHRPVLAEYLPFGQPIKMVAFPLLICLKLRGSNSSRRLGLQRAVFPMETMMLHSLRPFTVLQRAGLQVRALRFLAMLISYFVCAGVLKGSSLKA